MNSTTKIMVRINIIVLSEERDLVIESSSKDLRKGRPVEMPIDSPIRETEFFFARGVKFWIASVTIYTQVSYTQVGKHI